ncbi:MAG: 23S rRNA (uracil(1939)-C(5))-methyltransferase RlmD [Clostridia bacterium]
MKQDDIIELTIEALGTDGAGIAHKGEDTFFIPYTLIGERIRAKVKYVKKNIINAKLLEVLDASPMRRKPRCDVFGKCGGCAFLHMDYESQKEFKRNQLYNCGKKIGGYDYMPLDTEGSQEYGYRNKLVLQVGNNKGKTEMGFYAINTHKIIPINKCALHGEWAEKVIKAVSEYMRLSGETSYDESTHTGSIKHLSGRYIDGQLLLIVVVNNTKGLKNVKLLESCVSKYFEKYGLFESINTNITNVIIGDSIKYLCGIKEIVSSTMNIEYSLNAGSFFQVNDEIKDKIYTTVKSLIDADTEVVIDAYSGIGILTALLASERYDTIGIEIVKSAVEDADKISKRNKTLRQTNLNGDVNELLQKVFDKYNGKKITLVLDPVRKGLDSDTVELIKNLKPMKIIYISCNVATQARDVGMIMDSNDYEIKYAKVFDQFPQTITSESVMCLTIK